jgi:hypothetical protein
MKRTAIAVNVCLLVLASTSTPAAAQSLKDHLSSFRTMASYRIAGLKHRINMACLTPAKRQAVSQTLLENGITAGPQGMHKSADPFVTRVRFDKKTGQLSMTVHTFMTTDNGPYISDQHPRGLPLRLRVRDYGKQVLKAFPRSPQFDVRGRTP